LRHPDNAEFLDFDDNNETHLAVHAVSAVELLQVFMDEPLWAQNKKGRTGVWLMVGRTHGGEGGPHGIGDGDVLIDLLT